ncbi:SDR family NAD(P)-dependent oxidoreductase [Antarctobacter sp.]|uniref:SDR family NAD(P)-dependent oxidoreductase n=1 Tax=Antarctobacter sp. TaxID=1872577 RepID=UPI003A94B9B8
MALLKDKYAIVTGAASARGLGKATARAFAEQGATVAILDLDADAAKAAAADLGEGHIGLACNVTDREACNAAIRSLLGCWGRIDILVNNAGITQPLKIMEIEPQNYEAVTDVNLRGTLYMSQAVIPAMRAQKSGAIVNLSSVSAQRGGGIFGGPHYSAAKAGVLGLTKAMARELAPDNVRVNAICPGFIATDITAGKLSVEQHRMVLDGIPMGRAGEASDVAGCALFLASDLSAYCTGTEVDVNGGSLIH